MTEHDRRKANAYATAGRLLEQVMAVMRKNRGLCPNATYADVRRYLDERPTQCKFSQRRMLCGMTYLDEDANDSIAVLYHSTPVLRFYPGGVVQYNTGGYRTVATKERINYYAPCRVYQKQGVWRFYDGTPFRDNTFRYAYGELTLYFHSVFGGPWDYRLLGPTGLVCEGTPPANDESANALFQGLIRDGCPHVIDYLQDRTVYA